MDLLPGHKIFLRSLSLRIKSLSYDARGWSVGERNEECEQGTGKPKWRGGVYKFTEKIYKFS